jgi:hypothetical protein
MTAVDLEQVCTAPMDGIPVGVRSDFRIDAIALPGCQRGSIASRWFLRMPTPRKVRSRVVDRPGTLTQVLRG